MRVLWRWEDSIRTSPPRPPSPPEGPPRGTNFSRRKAMQPLPPSPALTRILASSMNMGKQGPREQGTKGTRKRGPWAVAGDRGHESQVPVFSVSDGRGWGPAGLRDGLADGGKYRFGGSTMAQVPPFVQNAEKDGGTEAVFCCRIKRVVMQATLQ